MRFDKSLAPVLCVLLAIVWGCGTEEPSASQSTVDVVPRPDADRETTDVEAEPNAAQKPAEAVAVELKGFTNSIGMKFKLIPAGEFMMGSPRMESDFDDSIPAHRVRITKPYYLGVTEVTQGQWEEVMGTRPWEGVKRTKSGSEYAVSSVSWEEAVEFCGKLSEKEGREYRLPTEAQWEYACRAGTTTRYSFGNDDSDLGSYAWYQENTHDVDEAYAHEVGLKLANAWGLHDMHGNVSEWCQDWYGSNYYWTSPVDNPTGASTGLYRVNRGGSWVYGPWLCRSVERGGGRPDFRTYDLGFRVVLVPAE